MNVAASLSVNAFIGGAEDLKAHFNSNQMQSLSTHKLEINSLQIGGQGDGAKQFVTADEMLNAGSNFANTVFQHPVHFRVELQDYQSLDLPPPPNAADIQNAKDVIADCATRRATWLQFRNDLAFILANPGQFDAPQTNLSDLDNHGADVLNQINKAASGCLNNLKACQFVQVPEPDRSKLPNRKGVPAKVIVPNWVGLTLQDVTVGGIDQDGVRHIPASELGLKTQIVSLPNPTGGDGEIMSTVPIAGTEVNVGDTVILNVQFS